ncbi:hypothetical protein P154DRAFT_35040 [Amniculicola lignicola CBS 123094]|uniref:Uncharacterized protein n=1 Tax=Amniculicola lignicola CBS 123094 TaxID=1392246 RepID=A0A6A5WZV6_9PLEO|nr:hypothetical protein P154DRAFT_35040 [Amniculicola lignicola CBS 123094]
MDDPQGTSSLLPPSTGDFNAVTPPGLTPNTRSEAEAALMLNSTAQTDSAAPIGSFSYMGAVSGPKPDALVDEAKKAYRRPGGPTRTSSSNYEKALHDAMKQSSVSSHMSTTTEGVESMLPDARKTMSPVSATIPFPKPGEGVVPLGTGVGAGQGEVVKKARGRGLSLGHLARQQSWSEQDFKHAYSTDLRGDKEESAKGTEGGYGSGPGPSVAGP